MRFADLAKNVEICWVGASCISSQKGLPMGSLGFTDVPKETSDRLRHSIVIVPHVPYLQNIGRATSRAHRRLADSSLQLSMAATMPIRIVAKNRVPGLMEGWAEDKVMHEAAKEELISIWSEVQTTQRVEALQAAMGLFTNYVEGKEGALAKAQFEISFNAWLNQAFPIADDLEKKIQLGYGTMDMKLKDEAGKEVPIEQAVRATVEGTREALRKRLLEGMELFKEGKRIGDTNIDAMITFLQRTLDNNVFMDEVVQEAAVEGIRYLQDKDAQYVKLNRQTVSDAMKGMAERVRQVTDQDMEQVEAAIVSGRTRVVG